MLQKIYIDTSVVGGYFDVEFMDATRKFFKRLEDDEIRFVISDLLELELMEAPPHVSELLTQYPGNLFERVELTEEVIDLANKYIDEGVVGSASLADCRHIALATVSRVDVLASWNFKHIVNLNRIRGYNSVNLRVGYPALEIRSPLEILNYGN